MWKSMTIGKRIAFGMGVVIALLLSMCSFAVVGMNKTVGNAKEVIYGNKLDALMAQKEIDHLNWMRKLVDFMTNEEIDELKVSLDHKKCGFGKWLYSDLRKDAELRVPGLSSVMRDIEVYHKNLHDSAVEIKDVYRDANPELPAMINARIIDHLKWADVIRDSFLLNRQKVNVQVDHTKCHLGKWINSDEGTEEYEHGSLGYREAYDKLVVAHKQLHSSAKDIIRLYKPITPDNLNAQNEAKNVFQQKTIPLLNNNIEYLNKMRSQAEMMLEGINNANNVYVKKTVPSVAGVQRLLSEARTLVKDNIMTEDVMLDTALDTKSGITVVSIIAVLLGFALAVVIVRGIVSALKVVIAGMRDASYQTAAAALQGSQAAQMLSQGATEQAASLEETSSSLDQMNSMTRQNADSASTANKLAQAARVSAEAGNQSMIEMQSAMALMNESSDKISKIIKTIEEIAFQTNLLALNAAVEAARAGEHGKGFAVVADEVRNLAQRASGAAKDTAALIEDNIAKVKDSSSIAEKSGNSLVEIMESSKKVADIISEITAASKEQSEGINQVTNAVSQMDQITQQNASAAEQSAASSEELSAQADTLKRMVQELQLMAGGSKVDSSNMILPRQQEQPKINRIEQRIKCSIPMIAKNRVESSRSDVVKPEELIPFEDDIDDFEMAEL